VWGVGKQHVDELVRAALAVVVTGHGSRRRPRRGRRCAWFGFGVKAVERDAWSDDPNFARITGRRGARAAGVANQATVLEFTATRPDRVAILAEGGDGFVIGCAALSALQQVA